MMTTQEYIKLALSGFEGLERQKKTNNEETDPETGLPKQTKTNRTTAPPVYEPKNEGLSQRADTIRLQEMLKVLNQNNRRPIPGEKPAFKLDSLVMPDVKKAAAERYDGMNHVSMSPIVDEKGNFTGEYSETMIPIVDKKGNVLDNYLKTMIANNPNYQMTPNKLRRLGEEAIGLQERLDAGEDLDEASRRKIDRFNTYAERYGENVPEVGTALTEIKERINRARNADYQDYGDIASVRPYLSDDEFQLAKAQQNDERSRERAFISAGRADEVRAERAARQKMEDEQRNINAAAEAIGDLFIQSRFEAELNDGSIPLIQNAYHNAATEENKQRIIGLLENQIRVARPDATEEEIAKIFDRVMGY